MLIQETPNKQKATGEVALSNTTKPKDNLFPTKWQRVLNAFVSGEDFNRFEAERKLNDHCLHTTVSTLQAYGVTIFRKMETVKGWQGIPTRVCRYWLDRSEANLKRANSLLSRQKELKEVA